MKYYEQLNIEDYANFIHKHPEANFLQSDNWANLHNEIGQTAIISGIKQNEILIAAWVSIVKNAKRGRYLEIPGGPIADWNNEELVKQLTSSMADLAKKNNCVFVRFRPNVEASQKLLDLIGQFSKIAPMHLHAEHTNILDLNPDEADLLINMRRQTRYEVRRSEKRGVVITVATPSQEDIDQFYDIQAKTAQRHGFVQSSRSFLQSLRKSFGDNLRLYKAEKDGQLLNLALIIFSGDEVDYYEAASTDEARKEPGAYGIIWQAIKDARSQGFRRFNFWGIAYSANPHHRYSGVTTFKRGFGGRDVEFIAAHDIIIRRGRYLLNWLIETARRKKRGL